MADLELCNGQRVAVTQPDMPVFTSRPPGLARRFVAPIAGPPGPPSDNAGQPRYAGDGPPNVIIGAQPGDLYLDVTTGLIYRLG